MLHNSATFWDFSYSDGSFPSIAVPVDQPGSVTLSSNTSEVGVALTATLEDPDGNIANEMWQWESSPNQDPPTWTAISGANTCQLHSTAIRRREICFVPKSPTTTRRVQAGWPPAPLPPPRTSRGLSRSPQMRPVVGDEIRAMLSDADGGVANEVWQWESSQDEGRADLERHHWGAVGRIHAGVGRCGPSAQGDGELRRRCGDGEERHVSEATAAVDQKGAVTLSPQQPVVGEAVTATLTDADGDITSQAWQWERSPGTGEPEWSIHQRGRHLRATRRLPLRMRGSCCRVTVAYSDGDGFSGRSATSAPTERVDQRGAVTLSTSVPDVGIAVTATLADADGGVRGVVWQWQTFGGHRDAFMERHL